MVPCVRRPAARPADGTAGSPASRSRRHAHLTTYAARLASNDFLLSVIKKLQDADEEAHGDVYRQVFETSNHGWRQKQAA